MEEKVEGNRVFLRVKRRREDATVEGQAPGTEEDRTFHSMDDDRGGVKQRLEAARFELGDWESMLLRVRRDDDRAGTLFRPCKRLGLPAADLEAFKGQQVKRQHSLATPSAKATSSLQGSTKARLAEQGIRARAKLRVHRIQKCRHGIVLDAEVPGGADGQPEEEFWYEAVVPSMMRRGDRGTADCNMHLSEVLTSMDEYERHIGLGNISEWDEEEALGCELDLQGLCDGSTSTSWAALSILAEEDNDDYWGAGEFVIDHAAAMAEVESRLAFQQRRDAVEVCHRWDDDFDPESSANASQHEFGGVDDDENLSRTDGSASSSESECEDGDSEADGVAQVHRPRQNRWRGKRCSSDSDDDDVGEGSSYSDRDYDVFLDDAYRKPKREELEYEMGTDDLPPESEFYLGPIPAPTVTLPSGETERLEAE
jgi:hypothetical protein